MMCARGRCFDCFFQSKRSCDLSAHSLLMMLTDKDRQGATWIADTPRAL